MTPDDQDGRREGWYREGAGERWWDGSGWTDRRRRWNGFQWIDEDADRGLDEARRPGNPQTHVSKAKPWKMVLIALGAFMVIGTVIAAVVLVAFGHDAPGVTGLTLKEARERIQSGGLSTEVAGVGGPQARVCRQEPRAGDRQYPGDPITVFIGDECSAKPQPKSANEEQPSPKPPVEAGAAPRADAAKTAAALSETAQTIEWAEQLTGAAAVVCAALVEVGDRTRAKRCFETDYATPFEQAATSAVTDLEQTQQTADEPCQAAMRDYTERLVDERHQIAKVSRAGIARQRVKFRRATASVADASARSQNSATRAYIACAPDAPPLDTSKPLPAAVRAEFVLTVPDYLNDSRDSCYDTAKKFVGGGGADAQVAMCHDIHKVLMCIKSVDRITDVAACSRAADLKASGDSARQWRAYDTCFKKATESDSGSLGSCKVPR